MTTCSENRNTKSDQFKEKNVPFGFNFISRLPGLHVIRGNVPPGFSAYERSQAGALVCSIHSQFMLYVLQVYSCQFCSSDHRANDIRPGAFTARTGLRNKRSEKNSQLLNSCPTMWLKAWCITAVNFVGRTRHCSLVKCAFLFLTDRLKTLH